MAQIPAKDVAIVNRRDGRGQALSGSPSIMGKGDWNSEPFLDKVRSRDVGVLRDVEKWRRFSFPMGMKRSIRSAGMMKMKQDPHYQFVAALLVLVSCSGCNDPTAKKSSSTEPTSSDYHLTAAAESRNTSTSCQSAKREIDARDQTLEKAFTEWRTKRDAFYEARKSDYLNNANYKSSSGEKTGILSIANANEATPSQTDDRNDAASLEDKRKAFYAAYRNAEETLSNYDQIGCIESDEFAKKHREYNDWLGRE
jgi:hypothetical protein